MKILVTGGAGYIGSHAVVELLDQGHEVVVADNLENGRRDAVDSRASFYRADIREPDTLSSIFENHNIACVMNFAAYIRVDESVEEPLKYYQNNVYGVMKLLETMNKYNVKKIIFSSTAAVYGEVTGNAPVTEEFNTNPINPYGMSKLMAERIIIDSAEAYGINYVIFRYFNVAGAHEKYNIGQSGETITALVHVIMEVALRKREKLYIFGDDYDTIDGTCIRDYIHVVDLVNAHILGLNILEQNKNDIFNLGNGTGFSVKQMVEATEKVLGLEVSKEVVSRRLGDPASVVASSDKAKKLLGWSLHYENIDKIIETVWKFQELNK